MTRTCLFLAAALGLVPGAIGAQPSTGTIWGYVVDAQDAAVPDVEIVILNRDTGIRKTTRADALGLFEVPYLLTGTYTVRAEREGFLALEQTGIVLASGQKARIDLRLQVGRLEDAVSVTSDGPVLNLSSNEQGQLLDRKRLAELPVAGRNFRNLITLANGALGGRGQGRQVFNFNGGPASGTNYTMDGTDATSIEGQTLGFAPNALTLTSLDSIQEIRVSTSAYAAEVPRSSSGAVNVITRGGTNDFHLNAYEYFRDDALDATNFFVNRTSGSTSPLRHNQPGVNLGGPVLRNRLFFYAGYEGLRARTSDFASANVPTAHLRDRAAAALQPLLSSLPGPTRSTANPDVGVFERVTQTTRREDTATGRVDYHPSTSDTVFARYNLLDMTLEEQEAIPDVAGRDGLRHQVGTLAYTRIVSPSMVNELRLGYNDYNHSKLIASSTLPLLGTLRVPGLSMPGAQRTIIFPDTAWTIADNFSSVHGRHSLKFGFEIYHASTAQDDTMLPAYIYNTIDAFALNRPTSVAFTWGTTNHILFGPGPTTNFGFFAQDDFRVSPRLTLNLGVRYERLKVPTDDGNTPNIVDSVTGPFRPIGSRLYDADANNFAPRLGFAYSLTPKTVIRGGAGVFTSPPHQTQAKMALTANLVNAVTFLMDQNPGLQYPFDPASGAGNTSPSPDRTVIDPHRKDTYTIQWNVNVQRELMRDTSLEVGYLGTRGVNLILNTWENRFDPLIGGRPVPSVGLVRYIQWRGESSYHAFQASLRRRFSNNLMADVNYGYSHLIDIAGGAEMARATNQIQDYANLRASRGDGDTDVRHRFVSSALYELPFSDWLGRPSRLWDGWLIGAIVNLQSGQPLNLTTGRDTGERIAGVQRPDYVGGATRLDPADPASSPVLNRDAYAFPAVDPSTGLAFGDVGRNTERLFGSATLDLSIMKRTRIQGNHTIEVRAEIFNALNHTNFASIDTNLSSPRFGLATSAGPARSVQLALRYSF